MINNSLAFSISHSFASKKNLKKNIETLYLKQSSPLYEKKSFFGKEINLKLFEKNLLIQDQKKLRKKNQKNWFAVFGPGGGFFGVGTSELIVIGAVAWLVLGPKRLYQLARDIGKISGEIKNVAEEARQTFQQAIDLENVDSQIQNKEDSSQSQIKSENSNKGNVKKSYMKDLDSLATKEISVNEKKKDEKF